MRLHGGPRSGVAFPGCDFQLVAGQTVTLTEQDVVEDLRRNTRVVVSAGQSYLATS